ncbi:MAG: hypothetical protein JO171_12090 [Paludibacterium sp.]|uniref:hypothetical protein n=1 Tax=Paludibacterium sp. TaxID=1917523 RepID=UPI0025CCCBAA|nr:hypothetical protein [Paludibacterium sp.]MBV8047891.1 hypothetical protein [Paludibacterium sp.]
MQIGLSPLLQGGVSLGITSVAVTSASNTNLTTAPNTTSADTSSSASAIYHSGETAEQRFHLSTQTLQLLKRYDVRQMNSDDLRKLAALMVGKNEISSDDYMSAESLTYMPGGNGNINAIDVLQKHIQSYTAQVESGTSLEYAADEKNSAVGMTMLNRFAAIHDALQTDNSVQMAADNTISQAWNNRELQQWIQGKNAGQTGAIDPTIFGKVSSALDHLGVQRTTVAANATDAQKQAQAWKDYQAWQAQHPNAKIQIDLMPADKTDITSSSPTTAVTSTTSSTTTSSSTSSASSAQSQANAALSARYGYSLQTLQLLKGNDIRQMSADQLRQLTGLMQNRGEVTQQQVDGLQPALQGVSTKPFDYFSKDQQSLSQGLASGLLDAKAMQNMFDAGTYNKYANYKGLQRDGQTILDGNAVIQNDQQSQALLSKLADLHDTLQSDAQVQAVGVDGLQQQTNQSAFNTWVSWHSSDPSASNATPQYRTQADVDGIFNTLQSMGVQLSTAPKDASTSQKLTLAWQDYQRWQSEHSSSGTQSTQQQVDTYV